MTWIRSSFPVLNGPSLRLAACGGMGPTAAPAENSVQAAACNISSNANGHDSEATADENGINRGFAASTCADDEVERAIHQAISACQYPELRWIQFHCRPQIVVLQGTVSSFYMKQMAQEIIRRAIPSRRIENRLQVAS
ncbi:MAG: BON domain-containing protein [bacterium]|nr:BON domain-containing protein [bacterium]